MSFFDSIDISASGLTAERTRMDVTAENLANAQTAGYRRQEVDVAQVGSSPFSEQLSSALGSSQSPTPGGVEVTGIVSDKTPDQLVYDPSNPEANAKGYVSEPNVNSVTEMTDLIDESDSYQSDVTAMNTAKTMYSSTLDLLKS